MSKIYLTLVVFLAFALHSTAAVNVNESTTAKTVDSENISSLAMDCSPAVTNVTLEINNARAHLSTGGDIYYQASSTGAGYEIPKNTNTFSIFAAALWLGAEDSNGNLKMAAQTYRTTGDDFWPGPLNSDGETSANVCASFDRIWSVTKADIDAHIADASDGNVDGPTPASITEWPGRDNASSVVPLPAGENMAPFFDADGDGAYNASNGDYPLINGDEAKWFVFNDNGNVHTETSGSPLKVEIKLMAFGYNTVDNLQDVTFANYTITNKSGDLLKKTYLGSWVDPDLGNYVDDFVGCDTTRNLGICYNGDNFDEDYAGISGYGDDPPFVGVQILDGILTDNGEKIGMSSFVYYNNDATVQGNPQTAQNFYDYLKGIWLDGTPITFGGTGYNPGSTLEVPYMFPSNPANQGGWSECAEGNVPADRRFILSTGPFDIAAGESKSLTNAILWSRPLDAFAGGCPTFDGIAELADQAQDFYDANIFVDDLPPVITIDGDEIITVGLNSNFTAPGATATDNVDGNVTVTVDDSQLDLSTEGVYEILYTASDSNGNTSTVIVTVIVDGNYVSIEEELLNDITVYPNPVLDIATIDLATNELLLVELYNMQGQKVFEQISNEGQVKIDMNAMESGVYVYKVSDGVNLIKQDKFIKQ